MIQHSESTSTKCWRDLAPRIKMLFGSLTLATVTFFITTAQAEQKTAPIVRKYGKLAKFGFPKKLSCVLNSQGYSNNRYVHQPRDIVPAKIQNIITDPKSKQECWQGFDGQQWCVLDYVPPTLRGDQSTGWDSVYIEYTANKTPAGYDLEYVQAWDWVVCCPIVWTGDSANHCRRREPTMQTNYSGRRTLCRRTAHEWFGQKWKDEF